MASQRSGDPRLGSLMRPLAVACQETNSNNLIALLGYPCDIGVRLNGGRGGAARGPEVVAQLLPKIGALHNREYGIDIQKSNLLLTDMQFAIGRTTGEGNLEEIHTKHSDLVAYNLSLPSVDMLISVGGGNDQSWAVGRAWIDHLRATATKPLLTVINVDAHLDVRPLVGTPESPHSGSPFRQLVQYASENEKLHLIEFAAQGEQCSAEHVSFVEANQGEVIWLSQLGKEHSTASEIASTHPGQKLEQILHKCLAERRSVFFSFDIDGIRGSDAPGVSCPAVRGLTAEEALEMCYVAGRSNAVSIFDISEFNPDIESDRTCRLVCQMIYHFIMGYSCRKPSL